MPDCNFELQQLALADRHIEKGEKRIADQEQGTHLSVLDLSRRMGRPGVCPVAGPNRKSPTEA